MARCKLSPDGGLALSGVEQTAHPGGITQYGINSPGWITLAYRGGAGVSDEATAKLMQGLMTAHAYADSYGYPEWCVRLAAYLGGIQRVKGFYYRASDLDHVMAAVDIPEVYPIAKLYTGVFPERTLKTFRAAHPEFFVVLDNRIYFYARGYPALAAHAKAEDEAREAKRRERIRSGAEVSRVAKRAGRGRPYSPESAAPE